MHGCLPENVNLVYDYLLLTRRSFLRLLAFGRPSCFIPFRSLYSLAPFWELHNGTHGKMHNFDKDLQSHHSHSETTTVSEEAPGGHGLCGCDRSIWVRLREWPWQNWHAFFMTYFSLCFVSFLFFPSRHNFLPELASSPKLWFRASLQPHLVMSVFMEDAKHER